MPEKKLQLVKSNVTNVGDNWEYEVRIGFRGRDPRSIFQMLAWQLACTLLEQQPPPDIRFQHIDRDADGTSTIFQMWELITGDPNGPGGIVSTIAEHPARKYVRLNRKDIQLELLVRQTRSLAEIRDYPEDSEHLLEDVIKDTSTQKERKNSGEAVVRISQTEKGCFFDELLSKLVESASETIWIIQHE